ncbi:MAG: hypothetical protein ACRD50_07890 [Candidatus Acidiferrales bacterium]
MSSNGIRRTGPPQAVQKVRDNYYLIQVAVSESPSANWRRLFYEAKHDPTADFRPRSIEISGTLLRFRSDPATVEEKLAQIAAWMEKANQKEASMGGRSEDLKRRQEEQARDTAELEELNARWAKM